jgi:hypothetical protein
MMAAEKIRITFVQVKIGFIGFVELALRMMCTVGRSLTSTRAVLPFNPCCDLRFDCRILLTLPVPGLPILDQDVRLADAVVDGGGDHGFSIA